MGKDLISSVEKTRLRRVPKWCWIVLSAVIAIAVPVVIYTGPLLIKAMQETKPASNVLSVYSASLVRRDYSRAYSLCSEEFWEAMSLEDFAEQQKNLEQRYGRLKFVKRMGTEITVRNSESEWRAEVIMKFEFERRTVEFIYVLNHAKGNWAIYGYKETS
jgi:hypothetical protein